MKIIHIHAKCDQFEIFEQLPENKAVARLRLIKKMFNYTGDLITVGTKNLGFKKIRNDSDKLIVKTKLVNPTLF